MSDQRLRELERLALEDPDLKDALERERRRRTAPPAPLPLSLQNLQSLTLALDRVQAELVRRASMRTRLALAVGPGGLLLEPSETEASLAAYAEKLHREIAKHSPPMRIRFTKSRQMGLAAVRRLLVDPTL